MNYDTPLSLPCSLCFSLAVCCVYIKKNNVCKLLDLTKLSTQRCSAEC